MHSSVLSASPSRCSYFAPQQQRQCVFLHGCDLKEYDVVCTVLRRDTTRFSRSSASIFNRAE